jgi:hypothetical protein
MTLKQEETKLIEHQILENTLEKFYVKLYFLGTFY